MQFLSTSYVIVPKQGSAYSLLLAKKLAKALQDRAVPATVSLDDKATHAHKIIVGDRQAVEGKIIYLNQDALDEAQFDQDDYLNKLLPVSAQESMSAVGAVSPSNQPLNVVAVTACPTGVAHTFMSAEAIENYAKAQGWNVKVETRGQVGAGNAITADEVAAADLVFVGRQTLMLICQNSKAKECTALRQDSP